MHDMEESIFRNFWSKTSMEDDDYKKYHESYMENNHGSSAIHVALCIFFTVKCVLYHCMKDRYSGPPKLIFEYLTIILPLTLLHTLCTEYLTLFNTVATIFCAFKFSKYYQKINVLNSLHRLNNYQTRQIQSISLVRGLTYLITVFAILAVDFKIFPRYLAKTENYGYSLMDTGVGLFTLMSGFVHKDLKKYRWQEIVKSNAKTVIILIILGITRFVTVKALNYHEHVSEYGVHWNFFFTVAMCKVTSTFILYFTDKPLLLSIITLMTHELLLYSGLQAWVFSDAPREDLLSANREGISSCLGYTALYLFAVHVKVMLSDLKIKRFTLLSNLVSWSVSLWVVLYVTNMLRPISRTLANSAYCIFLCAVILTILSASYFLEALFQDKRDKGMFFEVPIVLTAINNNGLIYFLAANILTGAVNLSIRTLFVPTIGAIVILNIYMFLTLVFILYLNSKGIKI